MSPEPDEAHQQAAQPWAQSFEASLAPREGDLLSLPFDQYGRMRIVQNIAHALYTEIGKQRGVAPSPNLTAENAEEQPFKLRVLDVGGYPGTLRSFLSPDYFDVTVLDVVPSEGTGSWYVQGSGMELPFDDRSFHIVTALDTLEHIPNTERPTFLAQMSRVAEHAALLINPVQSVEADLAEETLNEYIHWILEAQQEQLAEHRAYGLPDFAATGVAFEDNGWRTMRFPVANVYNWLFMMIAKHYLLSLRDERASSFERTLDRFYNLSFSDADRALPAYRGVVVAVRPELETALHNIAISYPPVHSDDAQNGVRLQLTQVLMQMLDLKTANHESSKLRQQMERRDKHIAQMETRVALQDVHLEAGKARERALVQEIEAGRTREQSLAEALDGTREHIGQLEAATGELRNEIDKLRGALSDRDQHIHNLEYLHRQELESQRQELVKRDAELRKLDEEIRSKNEHILYLEKLLQGIQSGRVMRVTRAVSRFLQRG